MSANLNGTSGTDKPKWLLFLEPRCPACDEVREWLKSQPTLPGLEIIVLSHEDENIDAWADADFYDVWTFPALRRVGSWQWGKEGKELVIKTLESLIRGEEP